MLVEKNKELYKKWLLINKNLRIKLDIKSRNERKELWNLIQENVIEDSNPIHTFIEYKLKYYEEEIKEIYEEKMATEKIKPYLLNFIIWRLYNPNNGIRFLRLVESWKKRF